MVTPLVAGAFALAGVVLGVLLEPIRARVAARTRTREDRMLRCSQLVEAANAARAAILWLFRTSRIHPPPISVTTAAIADAEQQYWQARNDLKKSVLLLRLIGPNELIDKSIAVSDSDLDLRRLWFDCDASERQAYSAQLSQRLEANLRSIVEFTELARGLAHR